jgi:hypothetical protein
MNTGKIMGLIVGSLLASEEAAQAKFDGFYAGASVGYLNQNTSFDAKQNSSDPNAHVNNTHSQRGLPTADIFLGWGKVFFGYFYGGLEGNIDAVRKGQNQKVAEDTAFIFMSGRKGIGIATLTRFGYLIYPHVMIYSGLGIKITQFEHNIFEKADKISAIFSKRFCNLLTEVGIETSLNNSKNLAFRLAYSFTPKRHLMQKATNFPTNHMYRENGMFKTSMNEYAVKISLAYHF